MIRPNTDEAGALRLAKTERVIALKIVHAGSDHNIVTVSAGVAGAVPRRGMEPDFLIKSADTALYDAKAE